jgi:DNA-binding transcriptional MocR family regulator
MDGAVLTIGSLSKPIWGGLRVGWLRGPVDLVHRLAALRATIDMSGAVLDQLVAAELMPALDEVAAARRAELLPQRDALLAALRTHLPQWQVTEPLGGLSTWIQLDAPMSTALTLLAAQHGVAVVPGSRFGVDGTLERFLRLPFSLPTAVLETAVLRLAAAWHQVDRTAVGRQLVVA